MTSASTPTSWLYILYLHSQKETHSNSISSLQTDFLLDSATFPVPNIPTYLIITELFIVCNPDQHDT